MIPVAWVLLFPTVAASALLLSPSALGASELDCSDDLDDLAWGVFIDGKNASEGPEAYGKEYSKSMRNALKAVYGLARKHRHEPVDFGHFQVIRSLLNMEYLDDYAGLFDMSKGVAVNFRQAYDCLKSSVPTDFLVSIFRTDMEDLYDASCIPNGRPCRAAHLPVKPTLMKLFQSYRDAQEKASTTTDRLRALASLMKNLALLHPLPDRNGRSRLLLQQFELRRLNLACGTMSFNNNQNVYTDSVDTLAAKLQEGIDMYNAARSSGKNPWLEEGNVARHRERFAQKYENALARCTRPARAIAVLARGLSWE